jgi:hypothetical protein
MSDSQESELAGAFTIKHFVPEGCDKALCGMRVPPGSIIGTDPCVVCTALLSGRASRTRDEGNSRVTSTRYANSPKCADAQHAVQVKASDPGPVIHIRCPACRAVNDIPSLPSVCYVCLWPLGIDETWV